MIVVLKPVQKKIEVLRNCLKMKNQNTDNTDLKDLHGFFLCEPV